MDLEIKAKWLKALRDGRYRQGRNRLRRANNMYCCLGVLCDIVEPDGWKLREYCAYETADGSTAYLPDSVYRAAGRPNIVVIDRAMHLNDRGVPFIEIAEFLEQHL